MKNCGYCGRENLDLVKYCSECGTTFAAQPEPAPAIVVEALKSIPDSAKQIRSGSRQLLLIIAWVGVIILTLPGIFNFNFAISFPLGLLQFLGMNDIVGSYGYYAIVWFFYVFLTLCASLTSRRRTYFIIYTILCAFLALNVTGCRMLFSAISHMGC